MKSKLAYTLVAALGAALVMFVGLAVAYGLVAIALCTWGWTPAIVASVGALTAGVAEGVREYRKPRKLTSAERVELAVRECERDPEKRLVLPHLLAVRDLLEKGVDR